MIFSRPCRDWMCWLKPTQHCVLGYIQPSLSGLICKWGSYTGLTSWATFMPSLRDLCNSLQRFRNWCRPKPRTFSWFSPKENQLLAIFIRPQ